MRETFFRNTEGYHADCIRETVETNESRPSNGPECDPNFRAGSALSSCLENFLKFIFRARRFEALIVVGGSVRDREKHPPETQTVCRDRFAKRLKKSCGLPAKLTLQDVAENRRKTRENSCVSEVSARDPAQRSAIVSLQIIPLSDIVNDEIRGLLEFFDFNFMFFV